MHYNRKSNSVLQFIVFKIQIKIFLRFPYSSYSNTEKALSKSTKRHSLHLCIHNEIGSEHGSGEINNFHLVDVEIINPDPY